MGVSFALLGFYNRNGFIWGLNSEIAPKYAHVTIQLLINLFAYTTQRHICYAELR